MAIFNCKSCGGDLEIKEGATVVTCEYCGRQQTVPSMDNEKKVNLFNRANRLRSKCDFDKAASVYESIVAEFPLESEAYWGLCMCKYGVVYDAEKKAPTCHRTLSESIFDNENFDLVCENSEGTTRQFYRDEAKEIDRIQKSFLETAKSQPSYDIFICCKETAEDSSPTVDSKIARELYDLLTQKGRSVFFAGITLTDKPAQSREPYIYSALNTSKVMLAIGTNYEYYNDAWVKNDWSRFLALMTSNSEKVLIPCYRDIDSYDMPKEFRGLQSRDLTAAGALEKLSDDVAEMYSKKVAASAVVSPAEPIIKRGFLCLEDEDWEGADNCFDKILDIDPENADAYVLKLCSELKVTCPGDIPQKMELLDDNKNYRKAIRFGDARLKAELEGYNADVKKKLDKKHCEEVYKEAKQKLEVAVFPEDFKSIKEMLEPIRGYKGAEQLLEECNDADNCKNARAYANSLKQINSAKSIGDYTEAKDLLLKMNPFNGRDDLIDRCNEGIYKLCKGFLDHSVTNEQLKEITIALRYISEYKDSNELADLLEDGALDYYNKAKNAVRNDDFQRAEQLLDFAKGFLDVDELIECCKRVVRQNKNKDSEDYKRLMDFAGIKPVQPPRMVDLSKQEEKPESSVQTLNMPFGSVQPPQAQPAVAMIAEEPRQSSVKSKVIKYLVLGVLMIVCIVIIVNIVTKERTNNFRDGYLEGINYATVGQLIDASIDNPNYYASSWLPDFVDDPDPEDYQPALAVDGTVKANGIEPFKVHLLIGKYENDESLYIIYNLSTLNGEEMTLSDVQWVLDIPEMNYMKKGLSKSPT